MRRHLPRAFSVFIVAVSLFVLTVEASLAQTPPKNLCANGSFETGITGWAGQIRDNTAKQTVQHPEFLSWEQQDCGPKLPIGAKPEKSTGALKVTIKELPAGCSSHQTGVICNLSENVAAEANDLVVSFSAKLLEPAEANLQVQRVWGGGGSDPVNLTHEWKQFRVFVPFGYPTPQLIFSLIPTNTEGISPHAAIAGSFLLDNVVVQTVPKLKEQAGNLIKNGDFENDTFGWWLRVYDDASKTLMLPGENLSWERDNLLKISINTGALKVTMKGATANIHTHMTGAAINFIKPVKKDEGSLKVTFLACLLSPEKANLQVSRLYGGGSGTPVELTHTWKQYEVIIPLQFETGNIAFSLVAPDAKAAQIYPVIDGTFLLDNVVVTVVK
ncbi:MAG TPA: hypothetical protein VGM23_13950 [Armatimonadota bacterium]|jgi:hypothetical protein